MEKRLPAIIVASMSTPGAPLESNKDTVAPAIGADFYLEDGFVVFTEQFHLNRGSCCHSGCRHCPYDPVEKVG